MMGRVFVAGEEVVFYGSHKEAQILKDIVTGAELTFEEKYKSVVTLKNVIRLMITTNSEQAVHLDVDDRRWSVFEVPHQFQMDTVEGKAEARHFFGRIRDWMEKGGASHLLHHLLSVAVDRDFISFPYANEAKASDKELADPLIAALVEIGETGIIPHDLHGTGRFSNKALAQLLRDLGGRDESVVSYSKRMRKVIGGEACRDCIFMRELRTSWDPDVGAKVQPIWEYSQRGTRLPSLQEFRERLGKKIGRRFEHKPGEQWSEWRPPSLGDPISPESAAEFERLKCNF